MKDLRAFQMEKFKKNLEYVMKNSSFYSEKLKDIKSQDISRYSDLEKLPFTTADHIKKENMGFLCVSQNSIERIITLPSSGTSGPVKRMWFTAGDQNRTIDFFSEGMSRIVKPGWKVIIFMPWKTPGSVGDLLSKGIKNIGCIPVKYGAIEDYEHAGTLAAQQNLSCYVGLPSQMYQLCVSNGSLNPDVVLLSGDYVPVSTINILKQKWKCHVYNHYGMTEMGFGGGVECWAHDGYHLRDEDLIFEVVDLKTGKQALPGQWGEVVFTTLSHCGMPLIRYRTGDISRWLDSPCKCGSQIWRLDRVRGRISNYFQLEDKTWFSIHNLDEILCNFPCILDYTAKRIGNVLELRLKVAENTDMDVLAEAVKSSLPKGIHLLILAGNGFITDGRLKRTITM